MTYTELLDQILDRTLDIDKHPDMATRLAWEALATIRGRRGLRQEWEGISKDLQNDIFAEMRGNFHKVLTTP